MTDTFDRKNDEEDANTIHTFGRPPCKVIIGLDSLSSFGAFDPTLKLWKREFPLLTGPPISLLENPNDSTEGGELFIWPASLVLSKFLTANPAYVLGQTVIELGASHGVVSMTASAVGAKFVVATDRPHVLPYLKSNLALNPSCRCATDAQSANATRFRHLFLCPVNFIPISVMPREPALPSLKQPAHSVEPPRTPARDPRARESSG